MELRQLRYFLAVAEERHFGRAAERLHMAQPPLSQAVRKLESELGVELFTRTTRQVAVTPAGEALRKDAYRILGAVDDSVRRVERIGAGREGLLRLGLTGTASYRQLPQLARIVKEQLPGLDLEPHTEMLTRAQEAALVDSRIDAGVLRQPVQDERIAYRSIAREPLILVLAHDHPLVASTSISMADLRNEDFIGYPVASHSVVNDAVVASCRAAGFHPKQSREVAETSILLALVAAGLGIALVPESVQAIALAGVVYRPVRGVESVDLSLAWRKGSTSPMLKMFLAVLEANDVFISTEAVEAARIEETL